MCSVTWKRAVRLVFCGSSEVGSACRPILRMPPRLGWPAAVAAAAATVGATAARVGAAAATAVAAGFAAAWTVGATVAAALTAVAAAGAAVAAAAGTAVAAAAGRLVGAAGVAPGPHADRNNAAATRRRVRDMRASVSDDQRAEVARVVGRELDAVFGDQGGVGVTEAGLVAHARHPLGALLVCDAQAALFWGRHGCSDGGHADQLK